MPRLRSWWQKTRQHSFIAAGIMVALLALAAFILAAYMFNWDWTGFSSGESQITITSTSRGTFTAKELQPAKTLWDWLNLLGVFAIPVAVGLGAAWFTTKFNEQQSRTEHEVASDNQREAALQDYIDKISELLLKEHLGELKPEYEGVRKIARVRTLTVLPRLDARRKRSILQFLQESSLIDKGKRIVDLGGAFLDEADLLGIDLNSANLSRANLSRADLRGGNLSGTDLTGAILTEAFLTGATLTEAILTEALLMAATLQGANLTEATLKGTYLIAAALQRANLTKATLTKANLRGANLMDADLTDANLTDADLTGATITKEQWEKAKLLQGVTLPDGSIYP